MHFLTLLIRGQRDVFKGGDEAVRFLLAIGLELSSHTSSAPPSVRSVAVYDI